MTAHHILCIHGVGKHDDDWVRSPDDNGQSFEDLFKATWQKYHQLGDFDEHVKLHSIHYDDEINKIFGIWEKEAEKLKTALASSPPLKDEVNWFTGFIDKAAEARDEDNWQYTHLLDLLLFLGSPGIQDRLVVYVGNQIIQTIQTHIRENISFSLIGHSMGTAMAHKAIQALYNEGVIRETIRGDFRFESISMIANTSYALSRDRATHYEGIIRPSMSVGGCCSKWLNVNHRLDPTGQFMPFNYKANPKWLDRRIESRGWHKDITLTRISSPSIHSINHYFRDPSFHIPFIELTFGVELTEDQRDQAITDFESDTVEGKLKALEAHFKALDVSHTDSFKTFFESLKAFYDLIRSMR